MSECHFLSSLDRHEASFTCAVWNWDVHSQTCESVRSAVVPEHKTHLELSEGAFVWGGVHECSASLES